MPVLIRSLIALIFLSGCSSLQTRDQIRAGHPKTSVPKSPDSPQTVSPPETNTNDDDDVESGGYHGHQLPTEWGEPSPEPGPPQPVAPPAAPRIGLILGPGGARAFAHAGVLQEMQRQRIPVHAVAGIEWGALVAGLYAMRASANDAEWQMSKIKDDDVVRRNLIGGSQGSQSVRALMDFFRLSFSQMSVEKSRLKYSCPALNLEKNQVFIMSRGRYEDLLPFCVAYPPLFTPWRGNVAAVRDVSLLADQLRRQGANVVILVNVLGSPDPRRPLAGAEGSPEAVLWAEIASAYSKSFRGVHHVISLPLGEYGISSFSDRHEIIRRGAGAAQSPLKGIARQLGL